MRLRLPKRIDDHHPLDLASVRHILGQDLPAAERARGGDDGRVPIGDRVALGLLDGDTHQLMCLAMRRADGIEICAPSPVVVRIVWNER